MIDPATLTVVVKAAWAELDRQNRDGSGYVYIDEEIGILDGNIDMEARVKAILGAAGKA